MKRYYFKLFEEGFTKKFNKNLKKFFSTVLTNDLRMGVFPGRGYITFLHYKPGNIQNTPSIWPNAECEQVLRVYHSNKIIKTWSWPAGTPINKLVDDVDKINFYIKHLREVIIPLDNI